jgi:hypothetical protein
VLMLSESFYYNGDTSKEVLTAFSMTSVTLINVMKFGTGDLVMQDVINGIALPSSSTLLRSLVSIKRSSYLLAQSL